MVKSKKHHQQKKNDEGGGNQKKKSKTIAIANTNGNGNVWKAGEEYEIDLLESRKTATGEIEGRVQWKDAACMAVGETEWVSWDNLNEHAQARAAAWEKVKEEDEARKMRAERRRKLQLRKELEEACEGSGTGGGGGDGGGDGGGGRGSGGGAARGGARGSGGGKNMKKCVDDQKGMSTAAAGGTGTSISAPKLAEKSTNANTADYGKGKRGTSIAGGAGNENSKPEAKKKKALQKEDDEEEDDEEEPATMPYDVKIVVQCKESKSRQTLTLPSDSTIGLVKRDYIKARGHALSLELFDSLVFFYNGYPVTEGLVIGVISTPGVTLELHIRF